jgi:pimeloyl-ACP methyl ester carboxylesterase
MEFVEIHLPGRTSAEGHASDGGPPDRHALRIEVQWIEATHSGAPLLVFLHEGLGSVSMWRDFPNRMCAALECRGLVYSRPGYGQSTPHDPDEPLWPDFMHIQATQVLPALLHALNVNPERDPLVLLGHSDGGSIALLYAAQFPRHVAAAIVLAPHLFVEDITVQNIAQARQNYQQTDVPARLARHHVNADSTFWAWNNIWLDPRFRQWNIEAEVAKLRCPVLAVQGLNDEYGTLQQIRQIAVLTPQCTLLELSECGHSPHRDQTERLVQATQLFLQQHCLETHHESC